MTGLGKRALAVALAVGLLVAALAGGAASAASAAPTASASTASASTASTSAPYVVVFKATVGDVADELA
ncbi:MAG: hypothetical protein ACM3UX_01285, partial [Candidatus Woesearchaeota archaeon]